MQFAAKFLIQVTVGEAISPPRWSTACSDEWYFVGHGMERSDTAKLQFSAMLSQTDMHKKQSEKTVEETQKCAIMALIQLPKEGFSHEF